MELLNKFKKLGFHRVTYLCLPTYLLTNDPPTIKPNRLTDSNIFIRSNDYIYPAYRRHMAAQGLLPYQEFIGQQDMPYTLLSGEYLNGFTDCQAMICIHAQLAKHWFGGFLLSLTDINNDYAVRQPDHLVHYCTSIHCEYYQRYLREMSPFFRCGVLSKKNREVLELVAIQGMTDKEAADHLGISLKAVEGRLSRARQEIRVLNNSANGDVSNQVRLTYLARDFNII